MFHLHLMQFGSSISRLATLQLCLGVTKPGFQAYFLSYIWNFRDLRRQTSQSFFSLAAGSVVLVAHQNSFVGSLWQDFLQAGQPLQLLLPSFLSHCLWISMTELLLGIWWLRASKFQSWIHLKLFRGEVVMHTYDLSVVHAKIFSVKILFMARH